MDMEHVITNAERTLLADYDRQRRLRLARGIAHILGAVVSVGLAFSLLNLVLRVAAEHHLPSGGDPSWALLGAIVVTDALFGGALLAVYRGKANLASTCVSAAIALGTLSYLFIGNHGYTLGPQTLAGVLGLFAILVAVGYLGNAAALIATTLGLNLVSMFTLVMGIPFPAPNAALAAQYHQPITESTFLVLDHATALRFIPVVIILQWAVAALLLAGGNTYRHTLQDLADTRVAYERARQLDELKDQFITTVNHELRNPIMMMQTYVELLRLRGGALTPAKRDELISNASQAGRTITALIESILSVRELDQATNDFIPDAVNVRDTILTASQIVTPDAEGLPPRELRILAPADLVIWGDAVRLQQILTNLISNAMKYSPPDTPIEIAAFPFEELHPTQGRRASEPPPPLVEITVRDYGLGIPPEQLPLLFQRFVRLPRDLASSTIGNGLGLYLCRLYATAMGGRIWVESTGEEGQGSIFHLRLPVPPHRQQSAEDWSASAIDTLA
jgi:signal transduction histidine kinase